MAVCLACASTFFGKQHTIIITWSLTRCQVAQLAVLVVCAHIRLQGGLSQVQPPLQVGAAAARVRQRPDQPAKVDQDFLCMKFWAIASRRCYEIYCLNYLVLQAGWCCRAACLLPLNIAALRSLHTAAAAPALCVLQLLRAAAIVGRLILRLELGDLGTVYVGL